MGDTEDVLTVGDVGAEGDGGGLLLLGSLGSHF